MCFIFNLFSNVVITKNKYSPHTNGNKSPQVLFLDNFYKSWLIYPKVYLGY